jgi:hypothetical protein
MRRVACPQVRGWRISGRLSDRLSRCGKPFESLGWPYCSNDCKRAAQERRANAAVMAEVGIEPPTKRKCQECGGNAR